MVRGELPHDVARLFQIVPGLLIAVIRRRDLAATFGQVPGKGHVFTVPRKRMAAYSSEAARANAKTDDQSLP